MLDCGYRQRSPFAQKGGSLLKVFGVSTALAGFFHSELTAAPDYPLTNCPME